jgi:gliding motility-associated lipoprotein GldB
MKTKKWMICLLGLGLLCSCSKDRFKINTKDINLNVKIERFDQDFMHMDTINMDAGIAGMQKKYGDLFNHFTMNVVMMGPVDSMKFKYQLKGFLRDSMYNQIYKESQSVFKDVSDIQTEVTDAFKYIKYYFPDKKIPRVAMHISGFNQSIIATKDFISISIDNYLGADYAPYKQIAYEYQLPNMTRSKVAPDIILGYLMSEFSYQDNTDLLAAIISRGKILYLQSIFMPQRSEADLMGYTDKQLQWCQTNEKNMWTFLMENKHLYNKSQLVIAKYINPAPFTSFFPQDSPGQAAIWVGWQIVKSYMNNNTDVTLDQLMKNTDAQQILEESDYKP